MVEEYVAGHDENSTPLLYKQLVQDGQILMRVSIMPSNVEELINVSDEVIYDHINNLIEYMRLQTQSLQITPSGNNPRDGWPVIGWTDLYKTNMLATEWWNYVEFRGAPSSIVMTTSIGHSH